MRRRSNTLIDVNSRSTVQFTVKSKDFRLDLKDTRKIKENTKKNSRPMFILHHHSLSLSLKSGCYLGGEDLLV